MNSALRSTGLSWSPSRDFSLRNLDLNVPVGSIYGFLGPNGSGKTSTIRLFMGMTRPRSGTIEVLGRKLTAASAPEILAQVGYVPERSHLYGALTVGEQLRYHASFYPSWDTAWAKDLMERFDLRPDQVIARLSKGETGKLLLLLALGQRPRLLILDEPTDGLDPVVRRDVVTAVLDYVGECGATVFISSHLIHELERICDWVGILDGGAMVAEMPMIHFKSGIKRLRVDSAPPQAVDTPFVILHREQVNGMGTSETWVVRGWDPAMEAYFPRAGAALRDVIDLDLEDAFVELLRSARPMTTPST
ncbi:MAG: ABC transporter ATP-binding protein [Gemmatimonadota bacterium]